MSKDMAAYEQPELAIVGDFAQVTLGNPSWGFDHKFTCLVVDCQ